MAGGKKSVLFVCLGNICRSPMAEAVFQHMVNERGLADQWQIDSAGMMGWHAGKRSDSRTRDCLQGHNISCEHRGRQVTKDDFRTFQFIFGMDEENMSNLKHAAPKGATCKLMKLGSYDPEGQLIIEDPYYDGPEAFEEVYKQVTRCCSAFLNEQSK